MLAQRVAGTRVVPVFVKGVISKPATQVPFLRVFKDQKDRDWAAATLQILFRRYRDVRVSVNFGPPVFGDLECLISAMTKLITSEQTVFEDFGL